MLGLPFKLPFGPKKTDPADFQAAQKAINLEKVKEFSRGLVSIQDIIAPEAIEVDFTYQKINSTLLELYLWPATPEVCRPTGCPP